MDARRFSFLIVCKTLGLAAARSVGSAEHVGTVRFACFRAVIGLRSSVLQAAVCSASLRTSLRRLEE